ncbi:unnamed protein product [Orchesella dallaii]|uniref:Gustatory receptor n=1 Tax=Orchesella dallaii TaxID=48710 RepID=A0ABP1RAZ7_9HEXA
MANLFNAMMDFETRYAMEFQDYPPTAAATCEKNFLLLNTIFNSISAMGAHFKGSLSHPCIPHLIGYFFIEECQPSTQSAQISKNTDLAEEGFDKIWVKVVVVFMSWLLLSSYYISMNAELVCYLYLPGASFNRYLEILRKLMGNKNLHLNKPRLLRYISMFRQVQLMLISFNQIHRSAAIIGAVYQTVFLLTISSYGLLGLHSTLVPAQFMFFGSGILQTVTIIVFIFGTLGSVYRNSTNFNADVNGMNKLRMNRWFRKVLRSWPIQKVGFGKVNYMDSMTPFTLIQFSINCTLNMLLVE